MASYKARSTDGIGEEIAPELVCAFVAWVKLFTNGRRRGKVLLRFAMNTQLEPQREQLQREVARLNKEVSKLQMEVDERQSQIIKLNAKLASATCNCHSKEARGTSRTEEERQVSTADDHHADIEDEENAALSSKEARTSLKQQIVELQRLLEIAELRASRAEAQSKESCERAAKMESELSCAVMAADTVRMHVAAAEALRIDSVVAWDDCPKDLIDSMTYIKGLEHDLETYKAKASAALTSVNVLRNELRWEVKVRAQAADLVQAQRVRNSTMTETTGNLGFSIGRMVRHSNNNSSQQLTALDSPDLHRSCALDDIDLQTIRHLQTIQRAFHLIDHSTGRHALWSSAVILARIFIKWSECSKGPHNWLEATRAQRITWAAQVLKVVFRKTVGVVMTPRLSFALWLSMGLWSKTCERAEQQAAKLEKHLVDNVVNSSRGLLLLAQMISEWRNHALTKCAWKEAVHICKRTSQVCRGLMLRCMSLWQRQAVVTAIGQIARGTTFAAWCSRPQGANKTPRLTLIKRRKRAAVFGLWRLSVYLMRERRLRFSAFKFWLGRHAVYKTETLKLSCLHAWQRCLHRAQSVRQRVHAILDPSYGPKRGDAFPRSLQLVQVASTSCRAEAAAALLLFERLHVAMMTFLCWSRHSLLVHAGQVEEHRRMRRSALISGYAASHLCVEVLQMCIASWRILHFTIANSRRAALALAASLGTVKRTHVAECFMDWYKGTRQSQRLGVQMLVHGLAARLDEGLLRTFFSHWLTLYLLASADHGWAAKLESLGSMAQRYSRHRQIHRSFTSWMIYLAEAKQKASAVLVLVAKLSSVAASFRQKHKRNSVSLWRSWTVKAAFHDDNPMVARRFLSCRDSMIIFKCLRRWQFHTMLPRDQRRHVARSAKIEIWTSNHLAVSVVRLHYSFWLRNALERRRKLIAAALVASCVGGALRRCRWLCVSALHQASSNFKQSISNGVTVEVRARWSVQRMLRRLVFAWHGLASSISEKRRWAAVSHKLHQSQIRCWAIQHRAGAFVLRKLGCVALRKCLGAWKLLHAAVLFVSLKNGGEYKLNQTLRDADPSVYLKYALADKIRGARHSVLLSRSFGSWRRCACIACFRRRVGSRFSNMEDLARKRWIFGMWCVAVRHQIRSTQRARGRSNGMCFVNRTMHRLDNAERSAHLCRSLSRWRAAAQMKRAACRQVSPCKKLQCSSLQASATQCFDVRFEPLCNDALQGLVEEGCRTSWEAKEMLIRRQGDSLLRLFRHLCTQRFGSMGSCWAALVTPLQSSGVPSVKADPECFSYLFRCMGLFPDGQHCGLLEDIFALMDQDGDTWISFDDFCRSSTQGAIAG